MQKLILAAVVILASASPSAAAPCVPATLADYIGLGAAGCTVGDALFSEFSSEAAPGAFVIDEMDVLVTPVLDASNVGVAFGIDATAGPGDILGNAIGYRVGGTTFTSRSVAADGTDVTPDGAFTVVQFASDPLVLFDIGIESELFAQAALPASLFIDVLTEITIDGGLAGQASLNGTVTELFRVVPEPSAFALALFAIGAIVVRRRRFRHVI